MAGAVPGIHRGSSGNVCSLISSLILLSALSHCLLANQPELTPEQLGVLSMIHCVEEEGPGGAHLEQEEGSPALRAPYPGNPSEPGVQIRSGNRAGSHWGTMSETSCPLQTSLALRGLVGDTVV